MAFKIKYRLPQKNDKLNLEEYIKEHYENNEFTITASMGLGTMPYENWLKNIHKSGNLVFIATNNCRIIGFIEIRLNLSEYERMIYGDIGYGVRPSERKKGYASSMLNDAIYICRFYGMKDIIIGCFKDNIPSAKTIIKNGGILIKECDAYEKGRMSQYYKIKLL